MNVPDISSKHFDDTHDLEDRPELLRVLRVAARGPGRGLAERARVVRGAVGRPEFLPFATIDRLRDEEEETSGLRQMDRRSNERRRIDSAADF